MADQKVRLGIEVTADTSKARQAFSQLKNELTNSIGSYKVGESLAPDFTKAVEQATKLRGVLEGATDSVGNFNLTKFTRELDKSGLTMQQVFTSLHRIGADDAFDKLAQQIQGADAKVNLLTGNLKKFAQGLANTAMWTLQSNAIHAVESALSGALHYAQQLNKGLTDIAIVSDLNTQQLTEFARTANQMAKDLSASTNDVVSGALIYYQAGLSDEEVLERTETTIKLAQTSGESAEQISSYMTAIWNNFYDGSQSVEYYADAISYLGAVTAASNADIAEGMQAFAATANTVGLSFEYGASALTLLRDVTQQSASTIGNSLKTIFARLSSVKQGETLEDGVDYTKYTKALSQVGVEVVDVNGELRNMDAILDDLGSRWNLLNNAQKVALAQTVGGVRQYNNLISLMDNYTRFQELVVGAGGSTGYLQNQADEYAESWEAAKNRLQAAWQGIYDQIIDDRFFIKLTDFLTFLVNTIGSIIDGLGGLKGLLPFIVMTISSWDTKSTANGIQEIVQGIRELKDALVGITEKNNWNIKEQTLGLAIGNTDTDNTTIFDMLTKRNEAIERYIELVREGNTQEAAALGTAITRYESQINNILKLDKHLESIKNKYTDIEQINDTAKRTSALNSSFTAIASESNFVTRRRLLKEAVTNPSESGLTKEQAQHIQSMVLGGEVTSWRKAGADRVDAAIEAMQTELAKNAISLQQQFADSAGVSLIADEFEKAGIHGAELDRVMQGVTDQLHQAHENSEQTVLASEDWEEIINTVLADYSDLNIDTKQIADAAAQANKELATFSNKPNKEPEKWAITTSQIVQATSAILTMNGAMDGFIDSVKDGSLNVTSFATGLMGMMRGASTLLTSAVIPAYAAIKGMTVEEATKGGAIPQFLLGPGGALAVAAVLILLKAIISGIQAIIQHVHNASLAGQIEQTTDALNKQKNKVQELTSAYSELKSTVQGLTSAYDDLQEAFEKYGPGSPQYLLALEEYNTKLDELEKKYGSGIFTEENGIRKINEDAFAGAKLQELNSAKAYQAILQNQVNNLTVDKTGQDVKNARSTSNATLEGGYVTYNDGSTVFTIEEKLWNQIFDSIDAGIDLMSKGGTFNLEGMLKTAGINPEGSVGQYFVNLFDDYSAAIAAQRENIQFSDLAANTMSGFGVWSLAQENNIAKSDIENAINQYADAEYEKVKNNNEYIDSAKQVWASQQGYSYQNGNFLDAEGKAVDESEIPETAQLVRAYIQGAILSELQNFDSSAMTQILQDAGLDDEMVRVFQEQMAKNAAEAMRLAGANEDIEALGQKEESVSAVAQEIDHLVDSEEKLDKASQRFSRATNDNQGSLKKLASAAEQTQEGFDELEKGYSDWYKAIKGKDELAKAKAMTELKDSLSDIMDITDELQAAGMTLGDHFGDYLIENSDTVLKALEGDRDAILELQKVALEDIVMQLDYSDLDISMQEAVALVDSQMDWLHELVDNGDLKLGAVDNTELLGSLENTINALTTDVNQAELILAKMGFDAEVTTAENTVTKQVWRPATYHNEPFYNAGDLTGQHSVLDTYGYWEPETASEPVTSLKIVTADYVGGGNILGAKGGTSAGRSRAKNATAPKGGGGGKQQKTKSADRYHEVNAKIQQNSAEVEKLSTLESRLYGPEKLDAMKQEADLLQRQADLYHEKYLEAKAYYEQDKANLANNYGATFNPDGTIANYDSWYANFLNQYNSGAMDDEAWSKFEDAIKKYEESLNLMDETAKQETDAINKVFDKGLEAIEYKLKTFNKQLDNSIEYIDNFIKELDKDAFDAADTIALMGLKAGDIVSKMNNYREALADILMHHNIDNSLIQQFMSGAVNINEVLDALKEAGPLTEKEQQDLEDIIKNLPKLNEELQELHDEAYEELYEIIEKTNEELERQRDIIDNMSSIANHYGNIVDIVGKDMLGISDELLQRMADIQVTTAQGLLQNSRVAKETLEQELARLQAERDAEADANSAHAKALDEQIKKTTAELRDATEQWATDFENALQRISEAREKEVEIAKSQFEKSIAGTFGSLDHLNDAFDKEKELEQLYLKDFQRVHDLNQLARDAQKAIDNTDSIGGKMRLRDLQQEILEKQQSGAKVSEYEVGVMQRKLELEQARIAMEEAQNAKNMVRMTRDNEGNWSYTYTADAEKTADSLQNFEDKLYELEKFISDRQMELQDQWPEYLSRLLDEMGVAEEDRVGYVQEHYDKIMGIWQEFMQETMGDNQWLLDNFDVASHNLANQWGDLVLGQISGFDTLDGTMNNYLQASSDLTSNISTSWANWNKSMKDTFDLAGTPMDEFATTTEEYLDTVTEKTKEAADASKDLGTESVNAYNMAMDALTDFASQYADKMQPVIDANKAAEKSALDLLSVYLGLRDIGALQIDADGNPILPNPNEGKPTGMASGGYTGTWGAGGKMAMLHEKELVLNQHDTENFLTAIGFVRDITQMLSLNASVASGGLGNLMTSNVSAGSSYLDQNVTIHAEFPNATNHSEIEEAFSNLIGLASQYAGRKQ